VPVDGEPPVGNVQVIESEVANRAGAGGVLGGQGDCEPLRGVLRELFGGPDGERSGALCSLAGQPGTGFPKPRSSRHDHGSSAQGLSGHRHAGGGGWLVVGGGGGGGGGLFRGGGATDAVVVTTGVRLGAMLAVFCCVGAVVRGHAVSATATSNAANPGAASSADRCRRHFPSAFPRLDTASRATLVASPLGELTGSMSIGEARSAACAVRGGFNPHSVTSPEAGAEREAGALTAAATCPVCIGPPTPGGQQRTVAVTGAAMFLELIQIVATTSADP
jgi:hypothetical protein